jgi:hypothetical protein
MCCSSSVFSLLLSNVDSEDFMSKSAFTMISDRLYQRYHYESRFRELCLEGAAQVQGGHLNRQSISAGVLCQAQVWPALLVFPCRAGCLAAGTLGEREVGGGGGRLTVRGLQAYPEGAGCEVSLRRGGSSSVAPVPSGCKPIERPP